MLPTTAPWSDLDPPRAAEMLSRVDVEWWVCGGWAIDVWLGGQTREHADFDIGCARADVHHLVEALGGWEAFEASEGVLTPWPVGHRSTGVSLWLHREGAVTWDLQLMPEDVRDGTWRYRRDPRVSASLERILWRSGDGLRVMRPEVQLLYKSKGVRPRDQADFDVVASSLDHGSRRWLIDQLALVDVDHPWLRSLHEHSPP